MLKYSNSSHTSYIHKQLPKLQYDQGWLGKGEEDLSVMGSQDLKKEFQEFFKKLLVMAKCLNCN